MNFPDFDPTDWRYYIDNGLLENLGKYRKYAGASVLDFLRVIRNKYAHYYDLPGNIQAELGTLPDGFLQYFTTRFPFLFIRTYECMARHCKNEPNFQMYFIPKTE